MIIFLKTAKTGGTSIADAFVRSGVRFAQLFTNKVSDDALKCDVVAMTLPAIGVFRDRYPDAWNQAEKVAAFRNPFERMLSGHSYRGKIRTSLCETLRDPPTIGWKFCHFTCGQLEGMGLRGSEESSVHFLKFDRLEEDWNAWSNGRFPALNHLNKSEHNNTLSPEEALLAANLFKRDVEFYSQMA